mgnify:FL=1
MIRKNKKIFVAGHMGLVGSAIVRSLLKKNYKNILTVSKSKLDLTNQKKVEKFFLDKRPDYVIIAAAKVGGILSNQNYKAEYIYKNLSIQNNLIHSSYLSKVKKLIFLGSSCVYPKNCKQPIKEEYLLDGKLESTNDAYAIAKIAGIKMCQSYNDQYKTNFVSLMPTNTFGPNDNYNSKDSHFLPALIKKTHKIKKMKKPRLLVWGNGLAKRELIYVDDIADACIFFLNKNTKHSLINIGTGKDHTIKFYARLLNKIICPNKNIKLAYDKKKPNGTPRKVLDVSLAKSYGWKARYNIIEALKLTYEEFKKIRKK